MNIPAELSYTSDHEWVRIEGSIARIGITDYAQDALGDVVYVELPAVGTTLVAGDSIGEIESTKSVSDIYAPVSGKVTEINDALDAAPGVLNEDPYGEGWLCLVDLGDDGDQTKLMDAAAYEALISE
jgi:glycine cleavage system H protein